jgi:predicted nucleic acid-binding protein
LPDTLIDANVLLDLATNDARWASWSQTALERCADEGHLHINPIIYAEVSLAYQRIEDVERVLPAAMFNRTELPWEAAFLAGRCFMNYRRRGGARRSPLPDFYIGAHAAVADMGLLTRDATRYRTYFPQLKLLTPEPRQ